MIARIDGILDEVSNGSALVRVEAGLTYQVLLPAYVVSRLAGSVGQPVGLRTLHFIEGQAQGATMTPRLAGFLSVEDRNFFELFTTCKGIGHRRALRAMTLATAQIADAIADRDAALLQSLPEIGKRTAETIIATLRGKVDAFVSTYGPATRHDESTAAPPLSRSGGITRQAMEVLLQLGESRVQAMMWIDQAMREDEHPSDAQDLIARVYRIKAGG